MHLSYLKVQNTKAMNSQSTNLSSAVKGFHSLTTSTLLLKNIYIYIYTHTHTYALRGAYRRKIM